VLPESSPPRDQLGVLYANLLQVQRTEFARVADVLFSIFEMEQTSAKELDGRFSEFRLEAEAKGQTAAAL
jgi:hypothetical protein